MEQYVISVWNYRSETSYTFGPFTSWEDVQDFQTKVDESDNCEWSDVTVLNDPNLLGTGQEVSFAH